MLQNRLSLRQYHAAKERSGMGNHNMMDISQAVLFVLAGASLFGLTGYLLRDQITRVERYFFVVGMTCLFVLVGMGVLTL
jgi:hypothetical protein